MKAILLSIQLNSCCALPLHPGKLENLGKVGTPLLPFSRELFPQGLYLSGRVQV